MKLLNVLLPLLTFIGFVSAQAAIITAVLTEIRADAAELRAAFTAEDGARIETAGLELIDSIERGAVSVNSSRVLTLIEALPFAAQITQLQSEIDATAELAIAKKPVMEALGLIPRVLDAFTRGRVAVQALGVVFLTKFPASLHPIAQALIDDVAATMAEVIEVYSS